MMIRKGFLAKKVIKENLSFFIITTIVFFFQRVANKGLSTLTLKYNDLVKATQGSLELIVPTYSEIFNSIRLDLIEPLIETSSKEATTQTASVRQPGLHQPNLLGRSPSADIESQRYVCAFILDKLLLCTVFYRPTGTPGRILVCSSYLTPHKAVLCTLQSSMSKRERNPSLAPQNTKRGSGRN